MVVLEAEEGRYTRRGSQGWNTKVVRGGWSLYTYVRVCELYRTTSSGSTMLPYVQYRTCWFFRILQAKLA
jgi:hypothetical protein